MPSRSGDASDLNSDTDRRRQALTQGVGHGVTLGNFRIGGSESKRTDDTQPEQPPHEGASEEQG